MDRGPLSHLLSWLLLGVGTAVALTALSLPIQPFTGLTLQGRRVIAVSPGSPGDLAGIHPGDLVRSLDQTHWLALTRGPLAGAVRDVPLELLQERGDRMQRVQLVPTALPEGERRLSAALIAVACGFLLLGGWVWSERRDRLTRAFLLLCLAFAWLLTPLPSTRWPLLGFVHEMIASGASILLPALFVHFFALFPESQQARGRLAAWVSAAYLVATAVFAGSLIEIGLQVGDPTVAQTATEWIQVAAAVWFATGMLLALALFARSYLRAASSDTRRRLRVVLVGTALGAGPLAALIVVRNLFPEIEVPGERWAVVLTLLVPASFAWATVVHRIFDFRVAVRSGALVLVLAAAGVLAYFGSEWLVASWWPDLGSSLAGGSLAFIALAAALVGPANPWLRSLAEDTTPTGLREFGAVARQANESAADMDRLLAAACTSLTGTLGLDACTAFLIEDGALHEVAHVGSEEALAPWTGLAEAHGPVNTPIPVEEWRRAPGRTPSEGGRARWVLRVGSGETRALLLLGNRLAGAWFSTREVQDLERFAGRLEVEIENADLRRAATSHHALDRELREASRIQSHYLPRRAPTYPTLDCAAAALACEPVGGDYYDFVEASERTFTLAVGDARGHGVPAALTMAGVQASFRSEARSEPRPAELLRRLNEQLVRLDHPENFVGLLCARCEARTGRVHFANAGLTPPLVRRRGGTFEEISEAGVLLGVSQAAEYKDVQVQLGAGDIAVVYTDGLTEARRGDELFGVRRVREIVDRHAHRRAADILRALISAVRAWADRPLDDITVVVLRQLTHARGTTRGAPPKPLKPPLQMADTDR